jgi:hypothetical protein
VAGDSTDSSSSSTGDAIASNTHGRSPQHQCGSTAISRTTVCVVSAFGVVPDGYLATGVGKLGMAHPANARTTRLLTKLFATTAAVPIHWDHSTSLNITRMSLMKQSGVYKQRQTRPIQLLRQQRGASLCSNPPMIARPMRSRLMLHVRCQHAAVHIRLMSRRMLTTLTALCGRS